MKEYIENILLVAIAVVAIALSYKTDAALVEEQMEHEEVIAASFVPTMTAKKERFEAIKEADGCSVPTLSGEVKPVESGHTFKPYTGYWAYNLRTSQQWKLQQIARTDTRTGIRVVTDPNGTDRFCVALGTFWCGGHPEHIGRCFDAVMANGSVLHCVLADVKRTEDTKNNGNRYGRTNNDILEFIVQEKCFPSCMKGYGDMSRASEELAGDVKEIIVYDLWVEGFGKEK